MVEKLKRVLILPDLHAPFHDKTAWKLVLQAAKAFEWDTIVSLGDFYDCYSVSRYVKDPKIKASFDEEIEKGRKLCLEPLNRIPCRQKLIVLGNHEERPRDYLKDKAPEIYTKFDKEDWLGFRSTGWDVYEYHDHARMGKLLFTHEVGASGALAVLNAVQGNIVTGHDHQLNYVVRGTALGIMHVSATFGWLGDRDHAKYMHSIKAMRNWALGFGYGYVRDNGWVYLKPATIIKNSVVVEGRLFTA
jgi:hypothetical protein